MFGNMTLGKRIVSGIILMLALMVVVGAVGYYGLTRVTRVMEFRGEIQSLQDIVASFKEHSDQYFLATLRADMEVRDNAHEMTLSQLDMGSEAVGRIRSNALAGEEGERRMEAAAAALNRFADFFNSYVLAEENKEETILEIMRLHEDLVDKIKEGAMWYQGMEVAATVLLAELRSYFNRSSQENWEGVTGYLERLGAAIDAWRERVDNSAALRDIGVEINNQFEVMGSVISRYHDEVVRQDQFRASMDVEKEAIYSVCEELAAMIETDLQSQTRLSNLVIAVVIIAALIFGLLYAFLSTRKIVGKINGVISGVSEGADQVASASKQVSAASQNLADGSSHQAAFIEETSSSLEEISSMAKQNAEHAKEAKGMMDEVRDVVDRISGHMNDMATANEDISRSSHETDKIVKTIDEIAFQTNLLALNAAVEAARAGEAGAGFAVVADEVRNLAMRAAEAAKNTAQLIGNTIKAVKNGSELTQATKDSFQENVEISKKVGLLINEITEASLEQSQGIEQVSTAVAEMDRVTQENASGAEESASAAAEMNSQAESMMGHIDDLIALVHGKTNGSREKVNLENEFDELGNEPQAKVESPRLKRIGSPNVQADKAGDVRKNRDIPMEEEDFRDF